jgi:transposase InsO family protein
MNANQATWPITTMARLLKVSTSGFYASLGRGPSKRARSDADLLARIQAIHTRSRGTYGMPRIHVELVRQGVHVGRKRVARLMRIAGLCGVSRRRWITTTRRQPDARPAPDLVQRHFNADAPNRLWVADATYVPTGEGFLYLAVVLDVFSRRIVGWSMSNHLYT